MSMLILPRRFSAETASVDWSNPIAARFSAINVPLAGGLSRNFARPGGKPVQTYGVSTGTSIKVAAGLGGMGMDGTAITTQSHRLHSVSNATSTAWEEPLAAATWFAVVVRSGNNANGNAPIFANGAPSTSPYSAYAIVDNGGSGTARVECAVGGSSYVLDVGSIPNHRLTIIVGRYTGYLLEGFLNGAKQSSSVGCTGQVTYANHVSRGPSVGNFYDYTTTARSFNGQIYLVGVAPVALSDAEIRDLSANPWQLLAAPDDIIWLDAGGGGTTINCALGTATAQGYPAQVGQGSTVACTLGTATASGFAAQVAQGTTIACSLGTATATGYQAAISSDGAILCSRGTASAVGYQAAVSVETVIACSTGAASSVGYQAQIGQGTVINCALAQAAADGFLATITQATAIACARGTASALGYSATVGSTAAALVASPDYIGRHTARNFSTARHRTRNFSTAT